MGPSGSHAQKKKCCMYCIAFAESSVLSFHTFFYKHGLQNPVFCIIVHTYVIDILRGQQVKLFQLEWKLMERPYFFQIYSLWFLKGLRSLKNWLLQQLSIKSLDQNLDFSLKSRYFGFEKNTAIPSIFMTPVLYTVTL